MSDKGFAQKFNIFRYLRRGSSETDALKRQREKDAQRRKRERNRRGGTVSDLERRHYEGADEQRPTKEPATCKTSRIESTRSCDETNIDTQVSRTDHEVVQKTSLEKMLEDRRKKKQKSDKKSSGRSSKQPSNKYKSSSNELKESLELSASPQSLTPKTASSEPAMKSPIEISPVAVESMQSIISFYIKTTDLDAIFQAGGGMTGKIFIKKVVKDQSDQMREFDEINRIVLTKSTETWAMNPSKNRYVDIRCSDDTRVPLTGDGYIHGSYVDSYKQYHAYICCQGPMNTTVDDFWLMMWQEKSFIIVMLTKLVEQGKAKCVLYWPETPKQTVTYGSLKVECTRVDVQKYWMITYLKIISGKNHRLIYHYQFTDWPDHAIPHEPMHFLDFVDEIRRVQKKQTLEYVNQGKWPGPSRGPPIVVHCSAGVGRTGTFCAVDILTRKLYDDGKIDVKKTVELLRTQRLHSVQKADQYLFICLCMVQMAAQPMPTNEQKSIREAITQVREAMQTEQVKITDV